MRACLRANVCEPLQLELRLLLILGFGNFELRLDRIVCCDLCVGHSNAGQTAGGALHLVPGCVLLLHVVRRFLTEVVPDDAADGSLGSVGSAEGHLGVRDSIDLTGSLALDDAGIICLSESTICLQEFELDRNRLNIPLHRWLCP